MEHSISNKEYAITGMFQTLTYDAICTQLQQRGAIITPLISPQTSALVVGQHPQQYQLTAAQNYRVPILYEKQLLDLFQAHKPTLLSPTVLLHKSQDEILQTLRDVLYEPLEPNAWENICTLLDHCTESNLTIAIDYVQEHTAQWPDTLEVSHDCPSIFNQRIALFEAPSHWMDEILAGKDSPRHRLVKRMNFWRRKITYKQARSMLASQYLTQVRFLALGNTKLPHILFQQLAQSPNFQHLTHLVLHNHYGSAKPKLIQSINKIWQRSLTHVSLAEFDFRTSSFSHLIEGAEWSALQYLSLANVHIHKQGALALAKTSGGFPNLVALDLSKTQMGDAGGKALFAATSMPNLRILNLGENGLSHKTLQHIFAPNAYPALEHIYLHGNILDNQEVQCIAAATHLTHLKTLCLRDDVHKANFSTFLHAPHITNLEHLTLRTQNSQEIAQTIATTPHFTRLKKLDLLHAPLPDETLYLLAHKAPHLHTLNELSISTPKQHSNAYKIVETSPYFSQPLIKSLQTFIAL